MEEETLVFYGGSVKATGNGKFEGYLMKFTDKTKPDLEGEYFDANTVRGDNEVPSLFYHHGLDAKIGGNVIGKTALTVDDVGVWLEGQMALRDAYEEAVYGMVKAGKLGLSSGALPHLVERVEQDNGSVYLKRWIIGEASLTPTPAEPQNMAVSIKSLDVSEGLEVPEPDSDIEEKIKSTKKDKKMTKKVETPEVEEEVVDIDAFVKAKVDEQLEGAVKAALDKIPVNDAGFSVPNIVKSLGDSETKAFAAFVKSGQANAAMKASNDTDMNIGTDADGGYAVPTGHYGEIISKRDEGMLAAKLGVRNIPGVGTTVNVPIDNEADGEFVETGEASGFDRDAPALTTKAMTLLKYTKKVELSYELLQDEESRLLAFLSDFVGRGMAKTHNNLLLTEVAANGTQLKEFASATAIAVDELEPILFNDALGNYLDESGSVAWVMKRGVHGEIVLLDDANTRRYASNTLPDSAGKPGPTLLGYPVSYSAKSGATVADAKSVYFGNWNYVGIREKPSFTVLRDPYSKASSGQVVLHYYFRAVYGVLQAEAIGYGDHPTA